MHIALCSSKSLYKYYFMAVSVWKYEVGRKSLFSSSIVPMSLGSIFKNSEGKWQAKRQHTQLSWLRAHCSSQPPPPCFAMVLSWACNVLPAHMQPFSFDFKLSMLWSLFIWYKVISNSTSISSPSCYFLSLSWAGLCALRGQEPLHSSDRHSENPCLMNEWTSRVPSSELLQKFLLFTLT